MITRRELEVLKNISFGYTMKEIAMMLFVSHHTIVSHKKNLQVKLGAANCPELVRKGFTMGLLSAFDNN